MHLNILNLQLLTLCLTEPPQISYGDINMLSLELETENKFRRNILLHNSLKFIMS